MDKKYVSTTIGDQSLNARHFAAMSATDGPAAIIKDCFTSDEKEAKKMYDACLADVKKADEEKPKK